MKFRNACNPIIFIGCTLMRTQAKSLKRPRHLFDTSQRDLHIPNMLLQEQPQHTHFIEDDQYWDMLFQSMSFSNVPTSSPVTPLPTADPTPAPVTPSPTGTALTPAPITAAPVTPVPTPDPTSAPVTPPSTTDPKPAPITPSPTDTPLTPAPITLAPVTPAPVSQTAVPSVAPITVPTTTAPITMAPVLSSPAPSPTPVTATPIPTSAPVTPPRTDDPTSAPATPFPTEALTEVPIAPAPVTRSPTLEPTITVTQQVILTVALQGGAEFDDPKSYQSRALAWLEANPMVDSYSNFQLIQRYALRCIYESTNGDSWFLKTNWQDPSTEECTWAFLECSEDQVLWIDFELDPDASVGNNLVGTFPPEVILLNQLEWLKIGYNELDNEAVVDPNGLNWLDNLTRLTLLSLSGNNLEANGVPTVISKLTNLRTLDLSRNKFKNQQLDENIFAPLQDLQYLDLSYNDFAKSTIPTTIGGIPNLKYLFIMGSNVTKDDSGNLEYLITAANGNSVLEYNWIDYNNFNGVSIPTEVGLLTELKSFSLTFNNLVGNIPTEIGLATNMEAMWFSYNDLTGAIPTEIADLQSLTTFQFYNTQITGNMPNEICDLPLIDEKSLIGNCADLGFFCECCASCYPF